MMEALFKGLCAPKICNFPFRAQSAYEMIVKCMKCVTELHLQNRLSSYGTIWNKWIFEGNLIISTGSNVTRASSFLLNKEDNTPGAAFGVPSVSYKICLNWGGLFPTCDI